MKLSNKIKSKIDKNRARLRRMGVDLEDSNLEQLVYTIGKKQYLRLGTGDLLIGFIA